MIPGERLRALLVAAFGEATVSRVLDPAIADMQAEWHGARRRGDARAARRARLRGHADVGRAALLLAALHGRDALARAPWRVAVPAMLVALAGVLVLGGSGASFASGQLAFLAVAALAMTAAAAAPRRLAARSPWAPVAIGAALLAAVAVTGTSFDGARRWIALGPLLVVPGELCKPLLVLALAGHAARRGSALVGLALLGALAVPVALQPDPPTALVLVAIAGGAALAEGRRVTAAIAAVVFGAGAIALGLAGAAGSRLALLARAATAGGLAGAPSPDALAGVGDLHTDHALAAFAARTGALGLLLLAAGVALTLARMAAVARGARSAWSRSVAAGGLAAFAAQAALALAAPAAPMLLGYGGSSLVATFATLGLVIGAARPDQGAADGAAV